MGTFGRKIVDTNVEDLVKLLNKAFSDEWLAYYQVLDWLQDCPRA